MQNNRRDFLKLTGLAGAASIIPLGGLNAKEKIADEQAACTLIPTETAGPFPLDLTANTTFFRQTINETKTGVPFKLKLKIIGANNCQPMTNVRVNIWHCDKDGLYSGYSQSNNPGQAGLTYCRGYQFTDANGIVEFNTIFPGWYTGRICHIHFQVYVSSSYAAISQLTFDITKKQAIYAANPSLYTNGADPTSLSADNVFSDGYTYQMATLTENSTTGGYDSYLEVTVKGTGVVTGLGNLEKENAKNFIIGQNFPNPFLDETSVPLTLIYPSDVILDIYDLQGKKVASIEKAMLSAGEHVIPINLKSLGLVNANYVYQVSVKNPNGIYHDCKMMTTQP